MTEWQRNRRKMAAHNIPLKERIALKRVVSELGVKSIMGG
jgi:hypothetical protein